MQNKKGPSERQTHKHGDAGVPITACKHAILLEQLGSVLALIIGFLIAVETGVGVV